jgi:hypothetical protein
MSEFLDLLTQMCLQNLTQYGESIDREAILQAQNQKSGSSSKLVTHQSMIEFNNWGYHSIVFSLQSYLRFKILCKQYVRSLDIFVDNSPLTSLMEIQKALCSPQSNLISDAPIQFLPRACQHIKKK